MNLYKNLLTLINQIHYIHLQDVYPLIDNIMQQNNSQNDINESWSSFGYKDITSKSLALMATYNFYDLDIEQIQKLFSHIDFSINNYNVSIDDNEYYRNDEYTDFSQNEIQNFVKEKSIPIIQDNSHAIGYRIFSIDKNFDIKYDDNKFLFLYDKFKKQCNVDKKILTENYRNFLTFLLNKKKFSTLDLIMKDFNLSINDYVNGKPFYFYLESPSAVSFVMQHKPDLTLLAHDGESYISTILREESGKKIIDQISKHAPIDQFELLKTLITQDKKKDDITKLMHSINEHEYQIKVKGESIINIAIEQDNYKIVSYLTQKYKIKDIIDNCNRHPFCHLINNQYLTPSKVQAKHTLINSLIENTKINSISQQDMLKILSNIFALTQHNTTVLNDLSYPENEKSDISDSDIEILNRRLYCTREKLELLRYCQQYTLSSETIMQLHENILTTNNDEQKKTTKKYMENIFLLSHFFHTQINEENKKKLFNEFMKNINFNNLYEQSYHISSSISLLFDTVISLDVSPNEEQNKILTQLLTKDIVKKDPNRYTPILTNYEKFILKKQIAIDNNKTDKQFKL